MPDDIEFERSTARYDHAERYDRGTRYNDRHIQNVMITETRANRFTVRFPDSDEAHVVDLSASPDGYRGTCSCRDHEYRDTVCKHMWAVFAADNPVLDTTDHRTPDRPRRVADGGAMAASESSKARSYGVLVEEWMERHHPIMLVDGTYHDAWLLRETGLADRHAPVQIVSAQRRIKNGYDSNGNQRYTAGRLTTWEEELEAIEEHDGVYLVAVYDATVPATSRDFISRQRWLSPDEMREALAGHWTTDTRTKHGQKGRVAWTSVLGGDPDV